MMREIIFASHNKGKIKELNEILSKLNIRVLSAEDLDLPDVEETGTTFEENALIKAGTIARLKNRPCLADDSGLCVDALNGRPGVYSARYAPNRDFDKAMDMLLGELENAEDKSRKAHFSCVMALVFENGEHICFEGRVDGQIALQKSGASGFGFDPLFIPDGYHQTFAELGADVKNKISHRARALEKLTAYIAEKGL